MNDINDNPQVKLALAHAHKMKAAAAKPSAGAYERDALAAAVDKLDRTVKSAKEQHALREALGNDLAPSSMSKGVHGGSVDVYDRIKSAGHDVFTNPRVQLGSVGAKALMSDGTDANIASIALAGDGQDQRFAYTAFPSLGLGNAVSVSGLTQSARALATPSGMDVAITGSTAKPESTVGLALTTWDAVMIATVTEAIANALWGQPQIGEFVRSELGYAVGLGIDSYLVTSLTGAAGTNTLVQDTYTLLEVYRAAIRDAKADGHSPDVLLLNPTDAFNLDVARDASDRFYGNGPSQSGFGSLWGVKIVESNAVTAGSPVLVDSRRFGKVYFGSLQFATNSYSDGTTDLFGTNQAIGRLETPMLVAVQDATAIVEITLN